METTLGMLMGVMDVALQAGLLMVFLRRKDIRQRFPCFLAYICCSLIVGMARASVFRSVATYFPVYWATEIVYSGFALLAVREAANRAWQISLRRSRWLRSLPILAVLVIVSIACWRAWYYPLGFGTSDFAHFGAGAYAFVMGAECLEGAAIVFGLRFSQSHKAVWRQRFGILSGLGISGLFTFAIRIARFHFGSAYEDVFLYGPPGVFIGVAAMWLMLFVGREPERPSRRRALTLDERLAILRRDADWLEKIRKSLGLRVRLCRITWHEDEI